MLIGKINILNAAACSPMFDPITEGFEADLQRGSVIKPNMEGNNNSTFPGVADIVLNNLILI